MKKPYNREVEMAKHPTRNEDQVRMHWCKKVLTPTEFYENFGARKYECPDPVSDTDSDEEQIPIVVERRQHHGNWQQLLQDNREVEEQARESQR